MNILAAGKKSFFLIISLVIFLGMITLIFKIDEVQDLRGRAFGQEAEITINTKRVLGVMPKNWAALAQGGEEKGVAMLANVVEPVSALSPHYIRLDHIYDFYEVVSRGDTGQINLDWQKLDATVCDILRTGARPFFSLGYMPPAFSQNGSLITQPDNWEDWAFLVQKTIEHYSGHDARICGLTLDRNLTNIYYEVWNEPDLETFGSWSLYGGPKDYKQLYYYSAQGAARAENTKQFFLGGPATTAAYRNWFLVFLDFIAKNKLRIDFLSWHHYSPNPADFGRDAQSVKNWLNSPQHQKYQSLPLIISEWGYDSNPNPKLNSNLVAAHTATVIRNLLEENLEMAFAFEIKDGLQPSWGILDYSGQPKPRYQALKLLSRLGKNRLFLEGEGTWVKAIASRNFQSVNVILTNFDAEEKHQEAVPVTFTNLDAGVYTFKQTDLEGKSFSFEETVTENGTLVKQIFLPANTVVLLELVKI